MTAALPASAALIRSSAAVEIGGTVRRTGKEAPKEFSAGVCTPVSASSVSLLLFNSTCSSLALVFRQDAEPVEAFPVTFGKGLSVSPREASPSGFSLTQQSRRPLQKREAERESPGAAETLQEETDSLSSARKVNEVCCRVCSPSSLLETAEGIEERTGAGRPKFDPRASTETGGSPRPSTVELYDACQLPSKDGRPGNGCDRPTSDGQADGARRGSPTQRFADRRGGPSSHSCHVEKRHTKRNVPRRSAGRWNSWDFRAGMIVVGAPFLVCNEETDMPRERSPQKKKTLESEQQPCADFVPTDWPDVPASPSLATPSFAAPSPLMPRPSLMAAGPRVTENIFPGKKRRERESCMDKQTSCCCCRLDDDSARGVSDTADAETTTMNSRAVVSSTADAICAPPLAQRLESGQKESLSLLSLPSVFMCLPLPVTTWWCVLHVLAHPSAVRRHAVLVVHAHTIRQVSG